MPLQKRSSLAQTPLEKCLVIVESLMNHKYGDPFNQPVDPVALELPDYLEIISEPRDFGTIQTNLLQAIERESNPNSTTDTENDYNIDTFMNDVRLVIDNCIRYNSAEHSISQMASVLSKIFERKISKLLEELNPPSPDLSDPPPPPRQVGRPKKKKKTDEGSDYDSGPNTRPKKKPRKQEYDSDLSGKEREKPARDKTSKYKQEDRTNIKTPLVAAPPLPPPASQERLAELALTDQQRQDWSRKLRLKFTVPEMLTEEGTINHEYFKPKRTHLRFARKWGDKEKELLITGIQKFGVGSWSAIRNEFLPAWEETELRLKSARLIGRQSLQAYKGWKGDHEAIAAEYQRNYTIGMKFPSAWKGGVLVADDGGVVADLIRQDEEDRKR
eukprot:TRINITY_DN865_c0_g1_i1.p1 TRINITY_DN865_c0_g1~~TRINITY_DN865_c0_g1_i1.p1  ORF type:complete len:404 (-),score=108.82 TRINITY_DN865_c0_g1_i1:168-1325(-)